MRENKNMQFFAPLQGIPIFFSTFSPENVLFLYFHSGSFAAPKGVGGGGLYSNPCQVGKGLSYRAARLQRLAASIPWNRFLGSLKV